MPKIFLDEEVVEEEEEEEILEVVGEDTLKETSLIFIAYVAIEMDTMHLHVSCLGTKLIKKEIKPR